MSGEIGVVSQVNRGACFWFEIPVTVTANNNLNSEPELSCVRSIETTNSKAMKVLIVEDNPVNQLVTKKLLERIGYSTKIATNGQEAIKFIKEESFNIILMDCDMPVMDGFSATRYIREWEQKSAYDKTPIIALTAHVLDSEKQQCFDVGMDDYITKPILADDLYQVVSCWVES